LKGKRENAMKLVIACTCDIYNRKPELALPERLDSGIILGSLKCAFSNKVLYLYLKNILESDLLMEDKFKEYLNSLKKMEEINLVTLQRTMEIVDEVLGDNYILVTTYRAYPYATHDVDLLVRDKLKTKSLFENRGFRLLPLPRAIELRKDGFLDLEIMETMKWGSIHVIDKEELWVKPRRVAVCGVETLVPNVEADLLTTIAHWNFQNYNITLGELFYVYSLSASADWHKMLEQVGKHGWLRSFLNTIGVLNGLHWRIYGKPSPMDVIIPFRNDVCLELPYLYSVQDVSRVLAEKGIINFVKLPSYVTEMLRKRSEGLAQAYAEVVLHHLGGFFIEHLYY